MKSCYNYPLWRVGSAHNYFSLASCEGVENTPLNISEKSPELMRCTLYNDFNAIY